MKRFDPGTDLDSMTEEELREAARQYAKELMAQDSEIEPFMLGVADIQVQSEPGIQTDSETVFNVGAEPEIRINTEPLIKVESEPDTKGASDSDSVADAEPVIAILQEASEVQAEESDIQTAPPAAPSHKSEKSAHKKGLFGRGKKESKEMQALAKRVADHSDRYGLSNPEIEADGPSIDLTKLKKNDLLEIMLRQAEEMDALRAENADLRAQLESREIKIMKSGSIAEAALKLTKVFEEAQKAADLYLANIRNETGEEKTLYQYYRGADSDE